MAQSLNKTVEFHTTGVSYLGVGERLEKILVGMPLLNFMRMQMLKTTSKFLARNRANRSQCIRT